MYRDPNETETRARKKLAKHIRSLVPAGIESSKQNNAARLRALANMGEAAAWPYQAEFDTLTAERVEVEKLYNADLKASTPEEVSNDATLAAAKSQSAWDSKAPNGRPSNLVKQDYDLVRTPEFKAWSGDWEVLAEDAAWKKTVEDYYLAPNRREPLNIGRVPPVLRIVGVSDAPMVMPPSVIQKVTVKKHTLTREMVEQIPSALRDPIFVFNSATAPDSVTVLTDIRHEGRNVIAAIHMDRPSPRALANIVVSLHERPASQIEKWIKDGLILYANQGKARAYFRSARLQLPREGSKAGNLSLRTEADVVNRFVNPAHLTIQTDENGEPIASEAARDRQEKGIFRSFRRAHSTLAPRAFRQCRDHDRAEQYHAGSRPSLPRDAAQGGPLQRRQNRHRRGRAGLRLGALLCRE